MRFLCLHGRGTSAEVWQGLIKSKYGGESSQTDKKHTQRYSRCKQVRRARPTQQNCRTVQCSSFLLLLQVGIERQGFFTTNHSAALQQGFARSLWNTTLYSSTAASPWNHVTVGRVARDGLSYTKFGSHNLRTHFRQVQRQPTKTSSAACMDISPSLPT
jgi:hypothetical protein